MATAEEEEAGAVPGLVRPPLRTRVPAQEAKLGHTVIPVSETESAAPLSSLP